MEWLKDNSEPCEISLYGSRRTGWEELIPDIEFTMNATIQKTLGKSPAEVLFGRKICRERWISNKSTREEIPNREYLTKRKFQIGEEVLLKIKTRTKNNLDLKVHTKWRNKFTKGDIE